MEKQTVTSFLKEVRDTTAWGMVSFMFNHKYANMGTFDEMNETLRTCGEHLGELEGALTDGGWDNNDAGSMIYYGAKGKREFNLDEFVQLMFDAKILNYFARGYIATYESYSNGFY